MNQNQPVELFRSMILQNGVIASDGSETVLCNILCFDDAAIDYFYRHYFKQPEGWEEQAKRAAYSSIERSQMLSRDLSLLTLWAQHLANLWMSINVEAACNSVSKLGFAGFCSMTRKDQRRMLSATRAHAMERFWKLRDERNKLLVQTKKLGKLLVKKLA